MIGLEGLAILASPWIVDPLARTILWTVVLAIGLWILLLALADVLSTRLYLRGLLKKHASDYAALPFHRLRRPIYPLDPL